TLLSSQTTTTPANPQPKKRSSLAERQQVINLHAPATKRKPATQKTAKTVATTGIHRRVAEPSIRPDRRPRHTPSRYRTD
ncbi:hypothetical protein, partial [Bifidobacterium biavatii]